MTHARAKIFARLIRKDQRSIEDVSEEDRAAVLAAYRELFNEDL